MRKQQTSEIQWSRLQRAIAEWVVGYGLLSVHIGLYLLVAVALVLLNLYRSPGGFYVQRVLIIWGVILLLHIGLVVVRTTLARATKQLNAESPRGSATSGRAVPTATAGTRPTGRFGAKFDVSSLERAQRFVQERVVQPVAARAAPSPAPPEDSAAAEPAHETSDHARETWPHANGAQAPGSVTQRGLALLNSSASHAKDLAERAQGSARDAFHRALGESEPIVPDGAPPVSPPPPTWPNSTRSPDRGASSLANSVTPVAPIPADGAPLTDGSAVFPPYIGSKPSNGKVSEPPAINGSKPVIPPVVPVPPEPPHKTDPKTEWTWMEAAAAAWLAQREVDEPNNDHQAANGDKPAVPPEQAPPGNQT